MITAMLKTFLRILMLCLFLSPLVQAQVNPPEDLTQKINRSHHIIEGKVIEQNSYWNPEETFIFTRNTIEIKRILKGSITSETIEIITPGGKVGTTYIKTSEIALEKGNSGVFFSGDKNGEGYHLLLDGYVKYDAFRAIAASKRAIFKNIESELIQPIKTITATERLVSAEVEVLANRKALNNNARTEAVEITSFVPTTVTAGTQTKLTINGTGFGEKRGNGQVIFTSNEFGGSTTFPLFNSGDYLSWSDTKIEVYVPSLAGTGAIIVQNDAGESFQSFNNLEVTYALHNQYAFDFSDPFGFSTSPGLIPYFSANNNDGGYTMFVDPQFYQTDRYLNPLVGALNRWRCTTGINIRLAANQEPIDFFVSGKSAISIIEDEFFNDSFSFGEYEECDTGAEKIFRLRHFRIFMSINNTSWNFEGNPSLGEKDFETELLRLFGKMSLLENVNDPNDLMYFQAPDGIARDIGTKNLEAANRVIAHNANMPTDCEWIPLRFVTAAECANSLSPAEARFTSDKTIFCSPGETVVFTSTSRNASSLLWQFEGGDIATATTERVKVTYNTPGTYGVKLTARNPAGEDVEEKINFITVGVGESNLKADLGEDQTICQGTTVVLKALGDTVPEPANITYEWSNGATTPSIEVTQAGTYSVVVKLAGCEATDEVKISFEEAASVDAGLSVTACGGDPVQLRATLIEGASYSWSPAEGLSDSAIFNPIAQPKQTTIYTVTVNTGTLCGEVKDSLRVSIGTPPELFGFPKEDTLYICGEVGFLDAFTDDFSASYEWSTGDRNGFIQVFEPGEYWVKVTASNGCVVRDTVEVKFVEEIDLQISGDTLACPGVPFQLKATGAQFYQWEPFELFSGGGFDAEVTARIRETTEISVTGYSGACERVTKTFTVTATVPPFLELGESDTIVVRNAEDYRLENRYEQAQYQWSTGDSTKGITVDQSGLYRVTMTPFYCGQKPLTDSVFVYFPNKINYSLGADTVVCAESITLNPFAANAPQLVSKIEWSTGETTPTILVSESGKYSVAITDNFGTTFTDEINITIAKLAEPFLQDSLFSCAAPIVLNTLNKGFATYEWSDGSTADSLLVTENGTYKVKITSQCGNTLEDQIVVTFHQNKLNVNLGADTLKLCALPYTLQAGNSGNSYLWSDGSTADSLVVTEAGTYSLTVTDSCGNQASDEIVLILNQPKPIDLGGPVITACQAPVLLDAGNGGISYLWSNGAETSTLEVTTSGEYSVTVTDSCGVQQTATAEVIIHKQTLDIAPATLSVCGGPVTFDATLPNAASYLWSDGSTNPTLEVNIAGTYSVTVTDSCGFEQTDEVVLIFENPTVDLGEETVVACGTELVLNAGNQGGTFKWSDGSTRQTLTVTQSGTYKVEVTPVNCEILLTDSITVIFPETTVNLGADTIRTCENTLALDAGTPSGTFLWSDGSTGQTLNVTTNGTYSVTVTDACGKEFTDQVVVFLNESTVLELGENPALICDATFALNAGEYASYLWSDGSTESTLTATEDGTYSVTVTDACGNTQTDEITLKFFKNSLINFSETFLGEGTFQFQNLSLLNFESDFRWDFGDGNFSNEENPLHTYQRIGEYNVTLSVGSGVCADSLSFSKTVSVIVAGLDNNALSEKIMVFPNPVINTNLRIQWDLNEAIEMSLVDALGRILKTAKAKAADTEMELNMAAYPKGMYYIRLISDKKQAIKKIIKQ